jgi:hypothetical protein
MPKNFAFAGLNGRSATTAKLPFNAGSSLQSETIATNLPFGIGGGCADLIDFFQVNEGGASG